MRAAIEVCEAGVAAGQSPFGAALGRDDGTLVAVAHNTVRLTRDPTAHAEINVIREACRLLGAIELSGCVLAATCEPCPMCAAAIHWARLDAVLYGATIADAVEAGFNELSLDCARLYDLGGSNVKTYRGILQDECRAVFRLWKEGPNPTPY